ncbi:hypothetical protein Neosp_009855 [[Neocosmospora] mangrovei]
MAILGWGYLLVFCSLKIIGSSMQLGDNPGSGAAIVTSVGLSPLLLAVAGVLHEAPEKRRLESKKETRIVILFHLQVMLGIALVAIGMSKLMSGTTQGKINQAWTIAKVGAAVLLLACLAMTAVAVRCSLQGYLRLKSQSSPNHSSWLMLAVLVALPFVTIRVLATFIYVVTENQSLSPMAGSLGVRVGLYLFVETTATLVLVSVGVKTRNIRKQADDAMLLDEGLAQ